MRRAEQPGSAQRAPWRACAPCAALAGLMLCAGLAAAQQGGAVPPPSSATVPATAPAGSAALLTCPSGRPTETSFRIDYAVRASRGPLSLEGESELVYLRSGGTYTLRTETRSVLYRGSQESRGAAGPRGLVPDAYVERSTGRRDRSVSFDRAKQTATYSAIEETRPLAPLAQDRLSLLLALGEAMRASPPPTVVTVVVAGARGESTYRFAVHERASVELPYGIVDTVRLQRNSDDAAEHFEVWLAPNLCWLPVQIRYSDERGQQIVNRMRALRSATP